MAYLIIFALELMASNGVLFNTNALAANQSTIISPSMVNVAGPLSDLYTIIRNVGSFFSTLLGFAGIFVLWQPTVFSGYMMWVWWFICLPIDLMMVFSIVSILRGVHSS